MSKPMLSSTYHLSPSVIDQTERATTICRLDERDDGSAIQEYLAEKTGQRTVPNIFISAY